jgi:hypothetical protein
MLKALVLKRVAAIAITFAVTTAIPYAIHDRPMIRWTWDKLGPVIVNRANDRFDLDVKVKTPTPAPVPPAPQPRT